jgi:hypothetical protein
MNDFFLKMILNQPAVARYAAMHGVDHVFVDLEIEGKYERQGHRDTLISRHTMYVGLNDLHIASGSRFMFEPLVNGVLDRVAETLHRRGMPFGFGGIARIGEGQLPAELILGEHVRLGSTSAILSRTFHRQARSIEEIGAQMDFDAEVGRIRATLEGFRAGGDAALRENHHKVVAIVSQILATFASGG